MNMVLSKSKKHSNDLQILKDYYIEINILRRQKVRVHANLSLSWKKISIAGFSTPKKRDNVQSVKKIHNVMNVTKKITR